MTFDLIIIGGGPAGTAASIYASRKQLKTLLITKEFGGQSVVSEDIQNWIGFPSISGADLAKSFKEHVEKYKGDVLEIKEGEYAEMVEKTDIGFSVKTNKATYDTKTVLIVTGSHRRQLTVPGADRLEHKGLTYCASCDGPLFSGQDVAVIGGGNAAFETASQLLAYAKSVTLLNRSDVFKADEITVNKVLSHPNMKAIKGAELLEILGDNFVSGLKYKINDEEQELAVAGIFAEIGSIPTTGFVDGLVEMTEYKQIKVDPKTQQTSLPGIWSAGDCTDGLYHQNNIAAGDAVKALEDIYLYLNAR
ncbi:hypothetical protein COW81_01340 [Candidatus Campbellbacteria bacterium CG22_combo_CG10-13_8_21_14_all_36_13]|uniref:FAD/NAD(P)-binding domain-containing protein n=1 Tax=Candidatus Campbellbacteria bacterium CG22_combo_CG10-13_8_21_14_all_36_13 TaxID=1974529 RepID=A0A2H0DYI4_9BACT|nr:MAG: hypothetical protein COW81_01340 [Candidatus Campbellbacteria bacterium CG22_combo_CG10-13_8_21_14_all_36_13]